MALTLSLAQDLVSLLDKVLEYGLEPGCGLQRVCVEAVQRVNTETDAYLAHVIHPNGGSASMAVIPTALYRRPTGASALPDGWEEHILKWFFLLKQRGHSEYTARAIAEEIRAIVRMHPISASSGLKTSSAPTVQAPDLLTGPVSYPHAPLEAVRLPATEKTSQPSLAAVDIGAGLRVLAPGTLEPSSTVSTPALSLPPSPEGWSTPETTSPATPGCTLPSTTADGTHARTHEQAASPWSSAARPELGTVADAIQPPSAEGSPGLVCDSSPRAAPMHLLLPSLLADRIFIEVTETPSMAKQVPSLSPTPPLCAPSTCSESLPERYAYTPVQPARPDALSDALAVWGIDFQSPRVALEGAFFPVTSPSRPSHASSRLRTSFRSNSRRSHTTPQWLRALVAPPPPTRNAAFSSFAKCVAARCQTFRDLLALSHLCQEVRQAVISASGLWIDIKVVSAGDERAFVEILARSRGAKQFLRIEVVVRNLLHFRDIIAALSVVIHRTEHLAISLANPRASVNGQMLRRLVDSSSSAPELRSLELRFNTDSRATSLFCGSHKIAKLTCQLWQLEKVKISHLDSIREFVALPPPLSVNQSSHSASSVLRLLRNVMMLVLDRAFHEKTTVKQQCHPPDRRPLEWLVLDQRTGRQSWDASMTAATLKRLGQEKIRSVALVHPLEDAAALVRDGLRDTAPDHLALLSLGGLLYVCVRCLRTDRSRFLLDASPAALSAFCSPGTFRAVVQLTLALYLPVAAIQYLADAQMCNLQTLILWLNDASAGMDSLLTQRDGPIAISTALREMHLVARFPGLPDVCQRYLPAPLVPRAPCVIAAADLCDFFSSQCSAAAPVALVVGEGIGLVGDERTLRRLLNQVGSIARTGPQGYAS